MSNISAGYNYVSLVCPETRFLAQTFAPFCLVTALNIAQGCLHVLPAVAQASFRE